MSIDKQKLVISEHRERFVEELHEHQEDGGDIGSSDEITATFNAYAKRARNKKFLLALAVALFTGAMVALMNENIVDYGGPLDHTPIKPVVTILGIIFFMPVAMLVSFPIMLITWALGIEFDNATPWLGPLFPFLVALFWGGVTAYVLFRPTGLFSWQRKKV